MNILVGVSGGIAAYKSAELVREFQRQGAQVQVAMTRAATRFVQPLTFAALTGRPVLTSLWRDSAPADPDQPIEHIAVARQLDALVAAPASADLLARLAHGLAGDYLTTLALATPAPLLVAPAMNDVMWRHPATQANLALLQSRGVRVILPEPGYLACGIPGDGRLAPIPLIAQQTLRAAAPIRDLAGETVLVTAGGTREPLDPVRYLGNRSSGRMGHALAEAARDRGAAVILITASSLPAPAGCRVLPVATAAQMQHALLAELPAATLVLMAAAVADFRPAQVSPSKLRRSGPLTLTLEPTPDLVALVAGIARQRATHTRIIAFAAETESDPAALETAARAKLLRKQVDAIVANDVSTPGLGFDAESNAGLFLTPTATIPLPTSTKRVMAGLILDHALRLPVPASTPVA